MPDASSILGRSSSTDDSGRINPDDVLVHYHPVTRTTGQRLAQWLGADGTEADSPNVRGYDTVIRWGCRRHQQGSPSNQCLNESRAIRRASNKFDALQRFENTDDVHVPPFTRDPSDIGPDGEFNWPVLGRDSTHSQGSDIEFYLQERDLELDGPSHHYVSYIPTEAEFRAHVYGDDIIVIHEKLLRNESDLEQSYCRNYETGWVFGQQRTQLSDEQEQMAVRTVDVCGLDFGAVDMILGEDGNAYVLEVNTAPSLDEPNLDRWGGKICSDIGIDQSDVPGNRAVEWDEDDE